MDWMLLNDEFVNLYHNFLISDEERDEFARNRAILQNKHFQHTDTLRENMGLFYRICNILAHSGIKIYVMIMPFTREYLRYIDPAYKKVIYEILDGLPFEINYTDFNEDCLMEDSDFLDQDHLTAEGAKKLSAIINTLIV